MYIQYVKFISLVLNDVNHNIPIYPFDPNYSDKGNLQFHYSPSISLVTFGGELGFKIAHYQDEDSRQICCLTCSDEIFSNVPNLLTDAVEMGFASWGGKLMTPDKALSLAQYLQPERQEVRSELYFENPENEKTITISYSAISLDSNNILTRTVTETQS